MTKKDEGKGPAKGELQDSRTADQASPQSALSGDSATSGDGGTVPPLPTKDEEEAYDASVTRHRELIAKLEKAAKGHGMDSDRYLMARAALHMRELLGMSLDEPAIAPDTPLAPVTNDPPIGHSLS